MSGLEKARPQKNIQVTLAVVAKVEGGHEAVLNILVSSENHDNALDLRASLTSYFGSEIQVVEGDRPASFESLYKQSDDIQVFRCYRTDNILTDNAGEAFAILARNLELPHSEASISLIIWRGEQMYPDAALSIRGKFFLSTYAQWDDQEDNEINSSWLRQLYDQLAVVSTGCYINEFDLEARGQQVSRCFSSSAWERLMVLRRRYDKQQLFASPTEYLESSGQKSNTLIT